MSNLTQHMIQAKAGLWKLFQHDVNQKQAMIRAAAAKGFGLPPEQYGQPFPGETNLTLVSQTDPPPASTPPPAGFLKPLLIGAGLLSGGALGALLLSGLLTKPVSSQPVPPAQQPAATAQPAPGTQAFDEVTEVQQPDGSWKEIDRQPFGTFKK